MLNVSNHRIEFEYFNQHCYIDVHTLLVPESSFFFSYGNTSFYIVIVRKLIDDNSKFSINSVKNFRVLYSEKAYTNNQIPNNKFKREGYNDNLLLIARAIDKSLRSNLPHTYYKYDINVVMMNKGGHDVEVAAVLGVNIAMKLYFKENFNLSVPFKVNINSQNNGFIVTKEDNIECIDKLFMCLSNEGICYVDVNTFNALEVSTLLAKINKNVEKINQVLQGIDNAILNSRCYVDYNIRDHKLIFFEDIKPIHYQEVENLLQSLLNGDKTYNSKELLNDFYSIIRNYVLSKRREFNCEDIVLELLLYQLANKVLCKYYIDGNLRFDGRKHEEPRKLKISCKDTSYNAISIDMQREGTLVSTSCSIAKTETKLLMNDNNYFRNVFAYYNFNNFASNEIGVSTVTRRSIGHGYIIENNLNSVFKPDKKNTFRFFTEVFSADGSTSLAGTMCSAILANIIDNNSRILSGVSIGLIYDDNDNLLLLSDITEIEDHFCYVDIKVVFDDRGNIIFLRIDSKVTKISFEVLYEIVKIGQKISCTYKETILDWMENNQYKINDLKAVVSEQISIFNKYDKENNHVKKYNRNNYIK